MITAKQIVRGNCRQIIFRRGLHFSTFNNNKYGWNEEINPVPVAPWINQANVSWELSEVTNVNTWLEDTNQSLNLMKEHFIKYGFVKVKKLLIQKLH